MKTVSTKFIAPLVLLLLSFSTVYAGGETWPIKRTPDLSSGFGDFRPRRFHAGIDVRTGGQIGEKLYSPVGGYVWRVKMSYRGYGKGLYVRGKDGHLYVFGHLSDFSDKIDASVKKAQIEAKRYYVDLYFPEDSIKVEKGELIGFSGQTGTGAPHLHFEKRTDDNLPINPLSHGFKLKDKTRPQFSQIGFELLDDHSLLENSRRIQYFDVTRGKKEGRYSLDRVLYFNSPFGVLAGCFDQMRAGGMKQAVRKLTLEVDKQKIYQVCFDTLEFSDGNTVMLNYDYLQASNGDKRVRRLYRMTGNDYRGIRSIDRSEGIVDPGPGNRLGLHEAKVRAEDCFGNKAELKFNFLWGPPGEIYTLDTAIQANDTLYFLHFLTNGDVDKLEIDSVVVEINRGDAWDRAQRASVETLQDASLVATITGTSVMLRPQRLRVYTASGCVVTGRQFAGMNRQLPKYPAFSYESVPGGLIVTVMGKGHKTSDSSLLPARDGLPLDTIPVSQIVHRRMFNFFVPTDPKFEVIDEMILQVNEKELKNAARRGFDCSIFLAGLQPNQVLTIDDSLQVHLNRDVFYEPTFVGLRKREAAARRRLGLNSEAYQIMPEAFVTAKDFTVSLLLSDQVIRRNQTGICWLDQEENRWVWLEDNQLEEMTLSGSSMGGGSFAAVIDTRAPVISKMSIIDGWKYRSSRPEVRFMVEDTLSGIEDDQNFDITIDDQWLIPEYDLESGQFTTKPHWDLDRGEHHLRITVYDRAGNKTEQSARFIVE